MNRLEKEVRLLRKQLLVLSESQELLQEQFDELKEEQAKAEISVSPEVQLPEVTPSENAEEGEAPMDVVPAPPAAPPEEEGEKQDIAVPSFEEIEGIDVDLPFSEWDEETQKIQEEMELAKSLQLALEEIGAPSCKVDGCTEEILSKGFCSSHYYKNHRHGDPLYDASKNRKKRKTKAKSTKRKKKAFCTFGECRGEHKAKGLCSYHYYRYMEYGDPGYSKEDQKAEHAKYEQELVDHYQKEAEAILSPEMEGVGV